MQLKYGDPNELGSFTRGQIELEDIPIDAKKLIVEEVERKLGKEVHYANCQIIVTVSVKNESK